MSGISEPLPDMGNEPDMNGELDIASEPEAPPGIFGTEGEEDRGDQQPAAQAPTPKSGLDSGTVIRMIVSLNLVAAAIMVNCCYREDELGDDRGCVVVPTLAWLLVTSVIIFIRRDSRF